jgi:rubrerythrin
MFRKYDVLVESLLNEGRKKDELKKFKFDLDSVKKLVEDLDAEDEHKGHFRSIVSKLKEKDFYTPKTFKNAISLIFKQLKKGEIADGYATIFYDWLKNHDESPLGDYTNDDVESEDEESKEHESVENKEPVSKETGEWFDHEPKEREQYTDLPEEEDEEDEF